MKQILSVLLLTAAMMYAADINGRWDSPTDMKNREGEPVVLHILLKQDGNKISGGVWTEDHDADQPKPIQNGTMDGAKLHFEVPQTADAVVIFDLEVSASTIDGTAKFQGPKGAQEVKLAFKRPR